MKKVIAILGIVALTSCGAGETKQSTSTDSTTVVKDTTVVKCDTCVVADTTK